MGRVGAWNQLSLLPGLILDLHPFNYPPSLRSTSCCFPILPSSFKIHCRASLIHDCELIAVRFWANLGKFKISSRLPLILVFFAFTPPKAASWIAHPSCALSSQENSSQEPILQILSILWKIIQAFWVILSQPGASSGIVLLVSLRELWGLSLYSDCFFGPFYGPFALVTSLNFLQ